MTGLQPNGKYSRWIDFKSGLNVGEINVSKIYNNSDNYDDDDDEDDDDNDVDLFCMVLSKICERNVLD